MKRYYAVFDMESPHMPALSYCTGGFEPDEVALWHGDASTLFHGYEGARNAIRKTKRYAKRHKLPWKCGYKIIRCETPWEA